MQGRLGLAAGCRRGTSRAFPVFNCDCAVQCGCRLCFQSPSCEPLQWLLSIPRGIGNPDHSTARLGRRSYPSVRPSVRAPVTQMYTPRATETFPQQRCGGLALRVFPGPLLLAFLLCRRHPDLSALRRRNLQPEAEKDPFSSTNLMEAEKHAVN